MKKPISTNELEQHVGGKKNSLGRKGGRAIAQSLTAAAQRVAETIAKTGGSGIVQIFKGGIPKPQNLIGTLKIEAKPPKPTAPAATKAKITPPGPSKFRR